MHHCSTDPNPSQGPDPNPSQGHIDPAGVTVAAHEMFHIDKALNADQQTFRAGDVPTSATGPAQQFGEKVSAEKPDITTGEAEEIVDEALTEEERVEQSLNDLQEGSCLLGSFCSSPTSPAPR